MPRLVVGCVQPACNTARQGGPKSGNRACVQPACNTASRVEGQPGKVRCGRPPARTSCPRTSDPGRGWPLGGRREPLAFPKALPANAQRQRPRRRQDPGAVAGRHRSREGTQEPAGGGVDTPGVASAPGASVPRPTGPWCKRCPPCPSRSIGSGRLSPATNRWPRSHRSSPRSVASAPGASVPRPSR